MPTDTYSAIGDCKGHVRVLTLNLWQRYGKWPERRALLIRGLRSLRPDVVAFQESICTEEYDQVSDILGAEYRIAHHRVRDPQGMGISIASRWPLGEVHELDLDVTPRCHGFPASTLIAEVLAPDPLGTFLLVNHFPHFQLSFEHERELQAVLAAQFIEERLKDSNRQVILVGDFDADPWSASVRFWTGRQSLGNMSVCYRDAWNSINPDDPGHTFTPVNPVVKDQVVKQMQPFRDWPFRRIDYILVRFGAHGGQAIDVVGCSLAFDHLVEGVPVSDHYGLVADLAIPAA